MARALFGIALLFAVTATPAAERISAAEAHDRVQNGVLLLVDVRTPAEWQSSGLPMGSQPLSMHDADFLERLDALSARHPNLPIALMCATGGRTRWLGPALESRGYARVVEVDEGMFGSAGGPGWLARGLPVVDVGGQPRAAPAGPAWWRRWAPWRRPTWSER
ncbi:MAG: rhodanese-like domain-containing protein [Pseudomonadales bacterium]